MEGERLMYLVDVQMAVAHQFSGKQEHGNFVPPARACGRIRIDVEHLDGMVPSRRQRGECAVQFIAQMTARARIQHEVRCSAPRRRAISDAAARRRSI